MSHDPAGLLGGHQGLALGHRSHGRGDLLHRALLAQIALGTRIQRASALVLLGRRGEDHDVRLRVRFLDASGRRDAVYPWHLQVHQHDVRLLVQGHLDRRLAVVDDRNH
jgi:hypothetical protein